MSIAARLLGLGAGYGRQALSRIIPASKERVLRNLQASADEMFSPARAEGATFDPRRNRFLEVTEQQGQMMSPVPNPPGGTNVARNLDDLLRIAQEPQNMRILRRGGYVGSWNSPERGGLVVDPSRRFFTKTNALRTGLRSKQDAGFNVLAGETYPVTQQAYRQARNRTLGAAATASGAALAAEAARGEKSITQDFLSGLRGGEQERQGKMGYGEAVGLTARNVASDPLLGIMAIPALRNLRKLGVKVGAEGGYTQAGKVFKNRARAIGVPEESLAGIADNESEMTAAAKAYAAARTSVGKMFNRLEADEVESARANLIQNNNITVPFDQTLSTNMLRAYGKTKKPKAVKQTKSSTITEDLADTGVASVPSAANPGDLQKLFESGRTLELQSALDTMKSNWLRFITQQDLDDIVRRNGVPVFYILHSLGTRARAASMNTPMTRLLGPQAAGSAAAGPVTEVTRGTAGLIADAMQQRILSAGLRVARPYKDLKGLKKGSKKYEQAVKSNKAREKELAEGYLINLPEGSERIQRTRQALLTIEDDIVKFLKDPTSVPGIQEKVYAYMGGSSTPMQQVSAVMDSWMMRAGFGNGNLSTAGNALQYKLVHEAFKDLARQLGTNPAALQEVVWKNVRIAARKAGEDSFLPLSDPRYTMPNVSATAKITQLGMPTASDLSDALKESNERFVEKLTRAVADNPEIADYFEIVGQDVQFTDKFFDLLRFFD